MSWFDGDEGTATSGADFVMRDQLACDDRFVVSRVHHTRHEFYRAIARRRTQELDRVVCGDRARRFVGAALLHQVPRRRPVAMTVEERADDPAVQHSLKRFVFFARLPLRDNLFAIGTEAEKYFARNIVLQVSAESARKIAGGEIVKIECRPKWRVPRIAARDKCDTIAIGAHHRRSI